MGQLLYIHPHIVGITYTETHPWTTIQAAALAVAAAVASDVAAAVGAAVDIVASVAPAVDIVATITAAAVVIVAVGSSNNSCCCCCCKWQQHHQQQLQLHKQQAGWRFMPRMLYLQHADGYIETVPNRSAGPQNRGTFHCDRGRVLRRRYWRGGPYFYWKIILRVL